MVHLLPPFELPSVPWTYCGGFCLIQFLDTIHPETRIMGILDSLRSRTSLHSTKSLNLRHSTRFWFAPHFYLTHLWYINHSGLKSFLCQYLRYNPHWSGNLNIKPQAKSMGFSALSDNYSPKSLNFSFVITRLPSRV